MLNGSRVTVKDTATVIAGDEDETLAAATIIVRHRGTEPVFLGGSAVKSTDGFELKAGDREEIRLEKGETLYGICAAGKEARVDVLETGD